MRPARTVSCWVAKAAGEADPGEDTEETVVVEMRLGRARSSSAATEEMADVPMGEAEVAARVH